MARAVPDASGCPSYRILEPTRRELLRLGGLAGIGLMLPDWLRAREQARAAPPAPDQAAATFGRARSIIMIYLHGGPAQQETWDPKPSGPYPERGEFGAISTSVPGSHFSELLP